MKKRYSVGSKVLTVVFTLVCLFWKTPGGEDKKLARRLNRRKEFRLEGACYKRPKGDPGPLLSPWYNRRQLGISADWNCEGLLFTPQLADQVMDGFRFLVPFYQYLISVAADGE